MEKEEFMFIGKDGKSYPTMDDVRIANKEWWNKFYPKIEKIENTNNFNKQRILIAYDGTECTSEEELKRVNDKILSEFAGKLIHKIYIGLDGLPYDSEEKRREADLVFINKLDLESISYSDSEAHHR